MAGFEDFMGLFNPQPFGQQGDLFALGSMMQQNPEALIPFFSKAGIPPPDIAGGKGIAPEMPFWERALPADQASQDGTWNPFPLTSSPPGDHSGAASFLSDPLRAIAARTQTAALPYAGEERGESGAAEPAENEAATVPLGQSRAADDPLSKPAGKGFDAASAMKVLAGLKAPASPEIQRISSPRVPDVNKITPGSPIAELLMKLTGEKQGVAPLRLGQALMGR